MKLLAFDYRWPNYTNNYNRSKVVTFSFSYKTHKKDCFSIATSYVYDRYSYKDEYTIGTSIYITNDVLLKYV
jgi:hypothetical protein